MSLLEELEQLGGTRSHRRIQLQAGFEDGQQRLRNGIQFLFFYVGTQNLLLDLPVVAPTVEEVLLVDPVVDAAAERPDVDLAVEEGDLHDHLWCRVVYVAAEVALLNQLLEVEGHADWVELDARPKAMEPARVNVSVDDAHLVDVLQGRGGNDQHVEYFRHRKGLLGVGLPHLRSWGGFHLDIDESILYHIVVENGHQARMPQLAKQVYETECIPPLLEVECSYVYAGHYFGLLRMHVNELENLAVAFFVEKGFELGRKRGRVVGHLIHWFKLLLAEALGVLNGDVLGPSHLLGHAAL